MKIYDLTNKKIEENIEEFKMENQYFIISNIEDFKEVAKKIPNFERYYKKYAETTEEIHFESLMEFSILNFVYYEIHNKKFTFEKVHLILYKNIIIIISNREKYLYEKFIKGIISEIMMPEFTINRINTMVFIYYQFLNRVFSKMFESLSIFESDLAEIENQILADHNNFELDSIVSIKNKSFLIQKLNRQLLYVGDQLILNDNEFFSKEYMRYLHNLDARINKLYEYSDDVYEMSESLMELYDSSVTSHTNDLINKLTVFTVIATPLTVITGLYGMNFKNMPELQNEHGYYIALGIMALSIIISILILKKKKIL
ncbi:magnesium transporter CorA family protein [Anaerosphaera aminiphila]|nr:CorA family divalent cation transporter [Anaerosphaera aminiphila]